MAAPLRAERKKDTRFREGNQTKPEDLEWLAQRGSINPSTGSPYDADASMVYRRLKVHRFMHRVPKARQFSFCGHCFAQLVTTQSRVWVQRQGVAA